MPDVPEIGKVGQNSPGSPQVNEPSSGAYGEKSASQQLQAQLPTMPASVPQQPDTSPPLNPNPLSAGGPAGAGPGRPSGSPLPDGVPAGILAGAPPAGAPAAMPAPNPVTGAANAAQGRILVLQQLASSPDVSNTTREWASTVLKVLIG